MEFRSDDDGGVLNPDGRPSGGGWLSNGLEDPDLSGVDPAYALSSSAGLADDIGLLTDSNLLGTARYLVECALPYGTSVTKTVDGQTIVLGGLLGLAPEWETGECDADCQEWVSACLLARTNVSGETVRIWVKGDNEGLGWDAPSNAVLEGAFYGNLFADPDGQYLCKGSALAVVDAFREGRTCSMGAGTACDFTAYSSCSSFSRCTVDGPNQDVPGNCKAGSQATTAAYHTVATYVVP